MSGPESIEIWRLVPAPVDEVFRWWTEPDLLRQWMSPVGSVEAEVDLRVGGRFRIVMREGDTRIDHTGEYLEIQPPARLVFTWVSDFTGAEPSLVTVELERDATGATRLHLLHSELPEAVAASHRRGWGAMLDRLAAGLARVPK